MEYSLGYREVIPDQTLVDKWKEIVLNTGESQSTLQDIKVPEKAGGYSYKNSSSFITRNRFIYWRIVHDVLELVEQSLDLNLSNNRVRYKFTDTPLLDGISIHENRNSVIILVATVSSIHRLCFTHPERIYKQDSVSFSDKIIQSIFNEATTQNARDPRTFYTFPTAGFTNSPIAHAAASWLSPSQEDAFFAFAYDSGSILLLRLEMSTGTVYPTELKQESMVPRFLSGIATALRGRSTEVDVTAVLSIHTVGNDTYLFTLCRDARLRMWSCSKVQCVAELDVPVNSRSDISKIHNHGLRKAVDSNGELYLCTYMKLEMGCEFSVLRIVSENGAFKFVRMSTLLAPKQHLIDYSFTITRLWAVWRSSDIDTVAVTHMQLPFNNTNSISEWESAILIQPPDKDYIVCDPGTDPRQAYINYIFHPGQFSLVDITRALSVYRRSNFHTDMNLSSSLLKERVYMSVEAEIRAEVMDYELTDEDYLEIVNRCWSKFYSCVLQYHLNRCRPVGLLLLPNVYGAVLLKKSSFSLLRPMESLEHLMLSNEESHITRFKTTPIFSQNIETCGDLITLMSALTILEEKLPEDFKSTFEKELYRLKVPDIVIDNLIKKSALVANELLSDLDIQAELFHKLEIMRDIPSAMAMLLESLTYDLGQPDKLELNDNDMGMADRSPTLSYFFGSQIGISTISETVNQIAILRFAICRNLLILQQIVLSQSERFDSQSSHTIKSSLAPRTVVLTQAYYIILWVCESNTSITPSSALIETSSQRLSYLRLSTNGPNFIPQQLRSFSLLELFIQHGAKNHFNQLVGQKHSHSLNFTVWHSGMLSLATFIAQLIWPISGNFFFPEWLLSSCQFLLVQEYVRLLDGWCEWNSFSRKFILAISLLEMGEPHKACDSFLRASNGISTDAYLSAIFKTDGLSRSEALIKYYLKVIESFEQHGVSDCIIELAMAAMAVAEPNNPDLPTIHSIIFAQHLNLEHHVEAYNCLNTNPDAARRVDCLRQLVVTLFNKKQLKELVSFPYTNMYQELEKIMESRARSVDLLENNYYDFLYSFHINKGNIRKAATVMYEQAIRLGQEPFTPTIVARQNHCLLACINALELVDEKYRWIVRPVDHNISEEQENIRMKRTIDGDESEQYTKKKQVELSEIEDIRRECVLTDAKLQLCRFLSTTTSIQPCPSEIVAIMSNYGLYKSALEVCDHFKLCKKSVLEGLTSHCLKLSRHEDQKAWNWLNENDVSDFNLSTSKPSNVAWHLLQNLVKEHEKEGSSELHNAITRKLIYLNAFIPEWLVSSYAKCNPSEFLRIMTRMGRLEEAAVFAMKFMQALLGKGQEYFNMETTLLATSPPVYFPFNTLQTLLSELNFASEDDPSYSEVYESLQHASKNYLKTVQRVSKDMIEMKTSSIHN